MESLSVAQRVVTADGNQHVDTDVLEILEDVFGDIVGFLVVAGELHRHAPAWQMARSRTRGVKESAAGSTGPIDVGLREHLYVVGIVGVLVATVIDKARPTAPNADDAVPFAQRANRDRPDRRVETGDVAAAGEDRDCLVARHA